MPWTDAFAPVEAKYREAVMVDTFGHLAPKKNYTYRGRIVYAVGCFGNDPLNPTVLACDFGDLHSSPWFFDHLMEFVREQKGEVGCVYEFNGSFRNYVFRGKHRLVLNAQDGAK